MLTLNMYRLLLVTCFTTLSAAIRVDWGTNKGPIVPPTPRTTIRPQLPYRAPAPVWEDQSDDIPNPNPYVYVLPPPSRPRTWPIPFATNDNYNTYTNNYGTLLTGAQAGNQQNVNALSPKYVPNIGFKYVAVVPKAATTKTTSTTAAEANVNYYLGIGDKLQGKYNAKTKKYKAYEKSKYTPFNYMQQLDTVELQQQQQQQLPLKVAAPLFASKEEEIKLQPAKPTVETLTEQTTTKKSTTTTTTAAATTTTTTTSTKPPKSLAKITTKYGTKFPQNMKQSQKQSPNAIAFSSNIS